MSAWRSWPGPAAIRRRREAGFVAALLTVCAEPALACPVCFAAKNEENRQAFINATAFMTATPLLLIGLVALWVWLRVRRLAAEEAAEIEAERAAGLQAAGLESPQSERSPSVELMAGKVDAPAGG